MPVTDDLIRKVLTDTQVIALVGASPNPDRPSFRVARFLQSRGYRVVPVNPGQSGAMLHGEQVYPDLAAIPSGIAVDMIDIFRRPDAVPGIVDQALVRFPDLKAIWMQLGVQHPDAAMTAEARGVTVIQNRCPAIEYPRLIGASPLAVAAGQP